MRLRTELAATVFGFLALNCLLAFAAIGLFGRMGPAIERILERNDATIAAAEDLLTTLAQAPLGPLDAAAEAALEAALLRAQGNITEPGEGPVLQRIEQVMPQAVAGKAEARQALTVEIRELIRINRDAMLTVDRQAQRLGRSGAWAAAVVAAAWTDSARMRRTGLCRTQGMGGSGLGGRGLQGAGWRKQIKPGLKPRSG